jgi:hypothetical protein
VTAGSNDLALVEESDNQSEGGTSQASSRAPSRQTLKRKQSSKSIKLTRSNTGGVKSKGGPALSRSKSTRGRSSRRLREKEDAAPRSALDIPVEEHLSALDLDTYECVPFIETMLSMFKAIVRFSEDKENLVQCKMETSTRSRACEDARDKSTALRAHYEEEFKIRADMEGLMLEYMKKERFYKSRVASFMEKVRVARLLNEVSMNGHTAISWAAANGAYELVEEMLSHGATVGFPIPLLNLTATFLQYSYKIYRMNCAFRHKPSEDDEDADPSRPPPPKVDSIQFVRDVTAMKELRDKVLSKLTFLRSKTRFPIPEAVYAGKWEIVKRIYERRLYHAQFSNTWAFPSAPFPYLRKLEKTYDRTKMSIREVLTYGMNDNAAG